MEINGYNIVIKIRIYFLKILKKLLDKLELMLILGINWQEYLF